MIHEISKPAKTQYWIFYCDDADNKHRQVHYGVTEPQQVTQSGMKNFKQFEDQKEWLAELKKSFDVTPEEADDSSGLIEVVKG